VEESEGPYEGFLKQVFRIYGIAREAVGDGMGLTISSAHQLLKLRISGDRFGFGFEHRKHGVRKRLTQRISGTVPESSF
jgi:hypothetical protein